MHSKWKVWDYIKSYPLGLDSNKPGLIAFYCFDPLVASLVKQRFPKDIFEESKLPVFQGKELKLNWFEDNFMSLGLFGNHESFAINDAETLDSSIKDFLQKQDLILDNRYLILFFNKLDDFFKTLSKLDHVQCVEIQAPAFWEQDKLLDFLSDYLKIPLSFEAKNAILNFVEPMPIEFYNLLTKLGVNFPGQSITLTMLETVLEKNRLDNFEMAKHFGFKKMKEFYQHLLEIEPDFESLRSLFYFLQTHMIKLADPSYIAQKNRPTKYDTQIQTQSKLWKQQELNQVLLFLKKLEFMAKTKNMFVWQEIKSALLRSQL
jgi:hypothetical protein